MNDESNAPHEPALQESERLDLAVYVYRVLAVLRPLDPMRCDAVLRATLELNRVLEIEERLHPPSAEPS